ncbi:MAG: ABC transporter ATP-binding protein [Thermotoga sp.]|nr:MAG: ABC transporter ATP-binding protein [Thermotoga sp.]HDM70878.1 ABC transporter ATP-binding protein [Thermotogales bacterium]
MEVRIKAENLTKRFGDFEAVKNLNLRIFSGEIYGFLGPNGAGKTTTVKMLTGMLRPTTGRVEILGLDMAKHEIEIKRRIGIVHEEPKLYANLKGYEFLNFISEVYNIEEDKRIEELCEAFSVDYLDRYISDMSHGMKQKLILVSVLMRKPDVLFLDEPLIGLDARSARILKGLLKKYASEGVTVFMTTHILEIAEKMCDRIGIIHKGQLIAEGTLEELRMKVESGSTLEDLFLQLTGEKEGIEEVIREL